MKSRMEVEKLDHGLTIQVYSFQPTELCFSEAFPWKSLYLEYLVPFPVISPTSLSQNVLCEIVEDDFLLLEWLLQKRKWSSISARNYWYIGTVHLGTEERYFKCPQPSASLTFWGRSSAGVKYLISNGAMIASTTWGSAPSLAKQLQYNESLKWR